MPVNEHGLWFGSQFKSRVGFGREFLKLRSCRVGTEEEEEEEQERASVQSFHFRQIWKVKG